jgi:hypothetical protein
MVELVPRFHRGELVVLPRDIGPHEFGFSNCAHRVVDYPWMNLMEAFDHPRWPIGYGTGNSVSRWIQYITRLVTRHEEL